MEKFSCFFMLIPIVKVLKHCNIYAAYTDHFEPSLIFKPLNLHFKTLEVAGLLLEKYFGG